MERQLERVFVGVLALSYASNASSAGNNEFRERQAAEVRLSVINTARVDEETLSAALGEAGRIFRSAGVNLFWAIAQTARPSSLPNANCRRWFYA